MDLADETPLCPFPTIPHGALRWRAILLAAWNAISPASSSCSATNVVAILLLWLDASVVMAKVTVAGLDDGGMMMGLALLLEMFISACGRPTMGPRRCSHHSVTVESLLSVGFDPKLFHR